MSRHVIEDYFARHRSAFLSFAFRILRNFDDAEDCVSDSILIALERSDKYDVATGSKGLARWLFEIVRNTAVCMAHSRRKETSVEPELFDALASREGTDWVGIDMAYRAKYAMRMAGLSPVMRQCIDLRISGLSIEDVAKQSGMKKDACKQTLARASRLMAKVSAMDEMPSGEAEFIFFLCSRVTVYFAPSKTGTQLWNEKQKKLR